MATGSKMRIRCQYYFSLSDPIQHVLYIILTNTMLSSLYLRLIKIHAHILKPTRGARVSELGAATWWGALAYTAASVKRVISTDIKQPLVSRIHENLRNTQAAPLMQAQLLDTDHIADVQTLVHPKSAKFIIAIATIITFAHRRHNKNIFHCCPSYHLHSARFHVHPHPQ